jgi:hypothetical protein
MEYCKSQYNTLQALSMVGAFIFPVDIVLNGGIEELAKKLIATRKPEEQSEPQQEPKQKSMREWLYDYLQQTAEVGATVGDAAINVVLLGIPAMINAASGAVSVAVQYATRSCFACHLAYLVHLWDDELRSLPKSRQLDWDYNAGPPIEYLSSFENMPLPIYVGDVLNCPTDISLFDRIDQNWSWLGGALSLINQLSCPLTTIAKMTRESHDGSKFLAAAKMVSPAMVRRLADLDCWDIPPPDPNAAFAASYAFTDSHDSGDSFESRFGFSYSLKDPPASKASKEPLGKSIFRFH